MNRVQLVSVVAVCGLAGSSLGQYDAAAPWPGYRGDETNRGSMMGVAGAATNFLWRNMDVGPAADTGGIAVGAGGMIYYKNHINTDERADGFEGAKVYQIDPNFGNILQMSPDLGGGSGNYAGVHIGEDFIWTARHGNGEQPAVLKLSKADLSLVAEYPVTASGIRGLLLGDGVVYAFDRADPARIIALNMADGSIAWTYELFGSTALFGGLGPIVDVGGQEAVFYSANTDLFPAQLVTEDSSNPGTGIDLWFDSPPGVGNFNWWGSGALSSDGSTIIVTTFNDGDTPSMWAIDIASASLAWDVPGQRGTPQELNFFSRPTVLGDKIYQAGGFGVLTKFDAATGNQGWERRDGGKEITNSVAAMGTDGTVWVYGMSQGDPNSDPDGDGVYDNPGDYIVLRDDGATFTELVNTNLDGMLISSFFASSNPVIDPVGAVYFSGGSWSAARPDNGDPAVTNPQRPGSLFKFGPQCSLADLAGPYGALDIFDIITYFDVFGAGMGDITQDGTNDIFDILTFFDIFSVGC